MGLQSHFEYELETAKFRPIGRISFDATVSPAAVRFTSSTDRQRVYTILKKSGRFNPRKSGHKTIRFMPMPRRR